MILQEKVLQRQKEYYQCNRGEILRKQSERDRTKHGKDAQPQSQGPSQQQPGLQFCPTMVPLQRTDFVDFRVRNPSDSAFASAQNGGNGGMPSQQNGHADCALVKL